MLNPEAVQLLWDYMEQKTVHNLGHLVNYLREISARGIGTKEDQQAWGQACHNFEILCREKGVFHSIGRVKFWDLWNAAQPTQAATPPWSDEGVLPNDPEFCWHGVSLKETCHRCTPEPDLDPVRGKQQAAEQHVFTSWQGDLEQVVIFDSNNSLTLQHDVNNWLQEQHGKIKVVDRQFAKTTQGTSFTVQHYAVMITYMANYF
jgi:hypothetical protein